MLLNLSAYFSRRKSKWRRYALKHTMTAIVYLNAYLDAYFCSSHLVLFYQKNNKNKNIINVRLFLKSIMKTLWIRNKIESLFQFLVTSKIEEFTLFKTLLRCRFKYTIRLNILTFSRKYFTVKKYSMKSFLRCRTQVGL